MKNETWTLVDDVSLEPIAPETSTVVNFISQSDTEADILKLVLGFAGRFGASNLLAGTMPADGQSSRQQIGHVLLNAWPTGWVLRYFSKGYLHDDPTIRMVREHHLPFLWSEISENRLRLGQAASIMHEARDFGLKNGFTIAFPTMEGHTIGFSIAGERIELADQDRNDLRHVARHAVIRALELKALQQVPIARGVTAREREALQLAADGWREHDIAIRMGISHHGAEKHLRSIRDKLEAKNTTHALAIAMRLGIVR